MSLPKHRRMPVPATFLGGIQISKTWFTADQHFGHANIIDYCNRPFKNTKRMKQTIVSKYPSLVGKDDVVYFLGDISSWYEMEVSQVAKIIRKLNGHKILILGSHDTFPVFDYVNMGFESVHTYLYLPFHRLHLAHDPAVSNVLPNDKWVCGHVHNLFKRTKNVVNVGVDVWDFKPVNISEITQLFKEKYHEIHK